MSRDLDHAWACGDVSLEELLKTIELYPTSAVVGDALTELLRDPSQIPFVKQEIVKKAKLQIPFSSFWASYIHFLSLTTKAVPLEVFVAALNICGHDPTSLPLWIKYLTALPEDKVQERRQIFHTALGIPLLQLNTLWKMYEAFELQQSQGRGFAVDSLLRSKYERALEIVESEQKLGLNKLLLPEQPSPDVGSDLRLQQTSQLHRWLQAISLRARDVAVAGGGADKGLVDGILQAHRRMLFGHFYHFDVSWLHYAIAVAKYAKDLPLALSVVQQGRGVLPDSALLLSLEVEITALISENSSSPQFTKLEVEGKREMDSNHLLAILRLFTQRTDIAGQDKKQFREIGKGATQRGVTDWHVYYQWALEEALYINDGSTIMKEAIKRGLQRVRTSRPEDFIEFVHHACSLLQSKNDESQVRSVLEDAIDFQRSAPAVHGSQVSLWQQLISYEKRYNGTHAERVVTTEKRATASLQPSNLYINHVAQSMIACGERYATKLMYPFTPTELTLLTQLSDKQSTLIDIAADERGEHASPYKSKRLFVVPTPSIKAQQVVSIDLCSATTKWTQFRPPANPHPATPEESANKIEPSGSRAMAGLLNYPIALDGSAIERMKRVAKKEEESEGPEIQPKQLIVNGIPISAGISKLLRALPTAIALASSQPVAYETSIPVAPQVVGCSAIMLVGRINPSWLLHKLKSTGDLQSGRRTR